MMEISAETTRAEVPRREIFETVLNTYRHQDDDKTADIDGNDVLVGEAGDAPRLPRVTVTKTSPVICII